MLRLSTNAVNISSLFSISFHVLSSSLFFSLAFLFNSLNFASREEMAFLHEQFSAHLPQEGQRSAPVPFPFVLTLSIQLDTSEPVLESLELGILDKCFFRKAGMCRITHHLVFCFGERTTRARWASIMSQILSSFPGNDVHLGQNWGLMIELVQYILPVFLFLQRRVKSRWPAVPGN